MLLMDRPQILTGENRPFCWISTRRILTRQILRRQILTGQILTHEQLAEVSQH